MCLQQAKRVRVITKALLANLRSNNDCGLCAPPFIKEKKDMENKNKPELFMINHSIVAKTA